MSSHCLTCGTKSKEQVCSPCFASLQESRLCIVYDNTGRVIFLPERSFVSLYGHKVDRSKEVSFDTLDKIHLVIEVIKELRESELA